MSHKIVRLFKILNAIQARPGISASELAERCETTERTIYRDLNVLSSFAPIMNEGYSKGYRFTGHFALYPLDFTEQESLVFSMLPSLLDSRALPPGFDSAYDKVMASHAREKSRQQEILENMTEVIQMGTPAYREEQGNFLIPIMEAILSQNTISTVYHTQSRNETTERKLDPYYLIPREQRFYVIGFCHLKQEVRTFRLSRFLSVKRTNEYFEKSSFNIKNHMKHTWSIERSDNEIHFQVKFSPDVARYVKEEELFVRPTMKDLPDGSLLFEVTVNSEREFLNWLFQYGSDAEVIKPALVREKIQEELTRWKKVYGN